jgi:nitrate/TMAO reductase-like tetraheme cytochrome c subunit
MRLIFICVLLLSIAILPYPVSAKKAATIDELVEMYNIKPCAECHMDKYEDWRTSTMGNSVIDPRVLMGMRTFIRLAIDEEESLKREDLTICLNCHAPQIKDAEPELVVHIGDLVLTAVEDKDEIKREAAKKELSKLNLNCLGCHNLKATGFNVKPEEKVIYGPKSIKNNPHEGIGFQTKKSDLIVTSEFCAECHHCPPDVPWNDCPTLYTTYIENYIRKGHKGTCQDCHMKGAKAIHKFFGPNNPAFLKSSISLSVNARPTKYINIYENKKTAAVVIKIDLKNNAGHVIPHGCIFSPKIVMNLTVKDQDSKEIFSRQKEFTVGDLYFKGGKQVAMAEWDVTATEHFDLGIKTGEPDTSTFIIPLNTDTKSVDVEVNVKYLFSRDEIFTIGESAQKVEIEN